MVFAIGIMLDGYGKSKSSAGFMAAVEKVVVGQNGFGTNQS
jgi:hypothetical protein